ncbi:MAG: sulfotransferase family 2 domain-containing protein [Cyclobacteriaceae bacterium]
MDWSEKAACTMAVRMFFEHLGVLDEAQAYSSWIHNYRIEVYEKQKEISLQHLRDNNYYKFKVVRSPYSRAVSSYFVLVKDKEYSKRHQLHRQLNLKTIDVSFQVFLEALIKLDLSTIDTHFRPQWRVYEEEFCFNKICHIENIDTEIEQINKATRANLSFKRVYSPHHTKLTPGTSRIVATDPFSSYAQAIPSYDLFYNKQTKGLVEQVYQSDITAYKYDFDQFIEFYGQSQ